jgi:outer membrane protein assembly factor BamD
LRRFAAGLVVVFALSACASDEVPYFERPVEDLYNEAMDQMLSNNFAASAVAFDEVERQHPYSVWATKAQIMTAFSYYQNNDYDEAILAAKRFINLHPGNRDVDYAYYLVAISYYEQISDIGRDQRMTELAFESLEEIVRRFPDSVYARDATLKINLTRDHLAGKEMEIGRFYQTTGQYIAAINRFRIIIEKYQTTSQVPEALLRLTESYLALGVADEAQATAAVLGYNFPGSDWYQDSYALLTGVNLQPREDEESWIGRAWKSIF